jgi:calcium-binding protein CML
LSILETTPFLPELFHFPFQKHERHRKVEKPKPNNVLPPFRIYDREEKRESKNFWSEKQTRPGKMGKDLSDDQVSSMKEAFTLFDTDGDGRIAPSELGILMRSLGGNPTQAQLKSIVTEENLTAPFDFPRFLDLMAKHMKAEPFDRQLRDAFKVLDKDSTGYVSVSELRHILTSIGEKLEPSEFDEWIREVEVGSDGRIRYEDFIARMVAK